MLLPGPQGLFAPRWSTDGRYLCAFTADLHKAMLFQPHTGQWSELAGGRNLTYPNWSRDSTQVYFEDETDKGREVFPVRVTDRRIERVVTLK